jgi:hypothetical protein
MNDTVLVLFTLGGTFVLAMAIDRGVPNMLEAAADILEDGAASVVASLRAAALKLRERHTQIEAANRQRHTGAGLAVVAKRARNAA